MFSLGKLFFPLITILLLCSCNIATQITPCVDNISFTAEAVWDNTTYSLSGTTEKESLTLKINSPERMKNCEFIFSGDNITVNYLGLTNKTNTSAFTDSSLLTVINEGINTARKTKINENNGKYYCEFEIADTEYTFIFGATGLPIEITDKSGKNRILFKNATILN